MNIIDQIALYFVVFMIGISIGIIIQDKWRDYIQLNDSK